MKPLGKLFQTKTNKNPKKIKTSKIFFKLFSNKKILTNLGPDGLTLHTFVRGSKRGFLDINFHNTFLIKFLNTPTG